MRSRSRGHSLTPRRLVLVWALSAAVLAAGIVVEQATKGPLDDPRQARQRPGLLIAAGAAPSVTLEVTDGIPHSDDQPCCCSSETTSTTN